MNLGEQYNLFATGRMSPTEEEQFRKEQSNTRVGPPWDENASFTGRIEWLKKKKIEPIKPKPAAIILKMYAEQLDQPEPAIEHIATRLHDLSDSLMKQIKCPTP